MRRRKGPEYEPDKTFLKPKMAKELAQTYGTPLFVYDRKTIEAQIDKVNSIFSWNPGHRGVFAVRHLHNPAVLKIIHEAGYLLQCCNAVELHLAQMAGVPGKDILFGAFFPDDEALELALSCGATIMMDRGEQLEDIPLHRYRGRVLCLRANVEEMQKKIQHMGRPGHSKLGMFEQELMRTISRARQRGFMRFSLSMVWDSMVYHTSYLGFMLRYLLMLSRKLRDEMGVIVEWCHIGGDLHWPTVPTNPPPSLEEEVSRAKNKWDTFIAEGGWEMPVLSQVGPYLTMPAGLLLVRVLGIKKNGLTHVGTDGGYTHMPRAMERGIHYHTSKVGDYQLQGRETVHLAGLLQERMDVLTKMQCLPPLKTGDLLVIHDAGAFGRSDSTNYGGTLRAAEVLLDTHGPRLICRRETIEDYIRCLQGDEQEHQETEHHGAQPQGDSHIHEPGDGLA